jgi:anti-sigma B factor antagonist
MEIIKTVLDDKVVKLQIGAELDDDTKTLSGVVELDIENQAHFVDVVNSVFEEGHVHLIVDMENVSYIDSSGLWALFEGHKKAAQRSGKLVLLNPTKDVKRVLDITKMSSKIQIFANQTDALAGLSAK